MARRAEGTVLERKWKNGNGYALRFRALGERQYVTLGMEADGWTRERAETELANTMADVRRGLWVPPKTRRATRDSAAEAGMPSFHTFALKFIARRIGKVAKKTVDYERWALRYHLLPYFATWALDEIDIEAVDDYRQYKVAQNEERAEAIKRGDPYRYDADDPRSRVMRPLAPSTVNKTIDILQAILTLAQEYDHINSNPAAGRRRRLTVPAKRPVHLDSAEQIQAMLDAAQILDRDPYWAQTDRLAHIATLICAGPRAEELCLALRRDFNVANRRIEVGRSKTAAGLREIHYLPLLGDILERHMTDAVYSGPDDFAFATSRGTARDKDNLRNRVFEPVVALADELLIARGQQPLPKGLTPHKLRHTFASVQVACGQDPVSVMQQLGHTDPRFTLKIYTHMMRRSPEERDRLRALVYGVFVPYDPGRDKASNVVSLLRYRRRVGGDSNLAQAA
jgi:integrase